MSDRAYGIATRLWERLSHEPDPRSERTVNPIAEALRAYAEEARREEREAWLNRAAEHEADIVADKRHTSGERTGAHMLGALLRADAAAIRPRGQTDASL